MIQFFWVGLEVGKTNQVDIGSLLQASHVSDSSTDCCTCHGEQWGRVFNRFEMRYALPTDGVALRGDEVAPRPDSVGEQPESPNWQDYYRCYVKVKGSITTATEEATTTSVTSTVTAFPFSVDLLWDQIYCSPGTDWLGTTNTAEECAKLCLAVPNDENSLGEAWGQSLQVRSQ